LLSNILYFLKGGDKSAPLSDFKDIKSGITTKVLERINKKQKDEKEKLCFSLVGEKKTLDIECDTEQKKKELFHLFKITLEQYKRNELKQIDSEEKEMMEHQKVLKKWNFDILSNEWKISQNLSKGENFTEEDAKLISNCLNGNSTLLTLDLQKSAINDAGLLNLTNGISKTKQLSIINMQGNSITDTSFGVFSKILKKDLKGLKILNCKK
jgi:hypothetical protein